MKIKFLAGLLLAGGSAVWASNTAPAVNTVENNVRKALVTMPYFSVFDDLSYKVDNGAVTLTGAVTQPYLKDYAQKAVKDVPGVTAVDNQIEVLPLSPFDDQIRFRTLRTLERTSSLYRYFMGTNPSIRIIVKNGHVTLDGIVGNSMDRQLAFMAANQISGVFSVTNDLRTEQEHRKGQ